MNKTTEFKSIADIRKHMIAIIEEDIEDDINTLIVARREEIPISFKDIYEEIARYENLIVYHKTKITQEENNVTN
jgi:hypothetical protein